MSALSPVIGVLALQGAFAAHARTLAELGATVREARDSAEHPESTAIVAFVDVTGSMGKVPRIIQKRLPELMGTLTRGGYCTDPQIMTIAVGDEPRSMPINRSTGERRSER